MTTCQPLTMSSISALVTLFGPARSKTVSSTRAKYQGVLDTPTESIWTQQALSKFSFQQVQPTLISIFKFSFQQVQLYSNLVGQSKCYIYYQQRKTTHQAYRSPHTLHPTIDSRSNYKHIKVHIPLHQSIHILYIQQLIQDQTIDSQYRLLTSTQNPLIQTQYVQPLPCLG